MWVRIKGILYNLALVQSIDIRHGTPGSTVGGKLELVYSDKYSRTISFRSYENAQTSYFHIVKTIDIPQLDQEAFHN
tara:strand:- start:233 stop:463 length:231 start_codon:yes stop_codon:yes gene_type:complete